MGRRIGIDLGTTNSVIAMTELGRQRCVKVDKNEFSAAVFPSAIAVDKKGTPIFGGRAAREPGCIRQFKRGIGTGQVWQLGNRTFSSLELSGLLLREIRAKFEAAEGEIEGAIITVPANYGELKRSEVREAGRLAGLHVLRVINEPSAAAIAYARSSRPPGMNTLVIDWGGGTLDVSLLDCDGDVLDIKASEGDEHCGGMDLDKALLGWMLETFHPKLGDAARDPAVLWELREWAEKIKIHLSDQGEWTDTIALRSRPIYIDEVHISRREFDRMAEPWVDRVFAAVDRCLRRAPEGALSPREISDVLFVGGSCHLPLLQERVEQRFGKRGRISIDPLEVVALGAAYQAEHNEAAGDLVTIHSLGHNLGVRCAGLDDQGVRRLNLFDVLLPATTKLPAESTHEYHTVVDNQQVVEVAVYEVLHDVATVDNLRPLASREFSMPPGPAASFTVRVTFRYNVEQNLSIVVAVPERGTSEEWVLEHRQRLAQGHAASQAKVDALRPGQGQPAPSPTASSARVGLEAFRDLVRTKITQGDYPAIRSMLNELDQALARGDDEAARAVKTRIVTACFAQGISLA